MFVDSITTMSAWAVPALMFIIIAHGYLKGVRVFDAFVEGAAEGLKIAVKIIPYIIGIYVAVGVFRESGAVNVLINVLRPVLDMFHIPPEIVLVTITRSLSGPASLGMVLEIYDTHGPDSLLGRMASTVIGSTDTTFYILAVYFGSIGVKNTRYAIPVGVMADTAALIGAMFITGRLYSN